MDVANQVVNININNILPNRFQPRIRFSEEALTELTNSIKEHGVIQPITVRPVGNKFEIVAGERRYKASVLAGKQTIPAIIVNLDDASCAELALIENVQRQDLTPIEEAISYKKILDMGSLTQEALAVKLGKNQSTIANKLRLLNLDDEVQKALLENRISERHARSLLKLDNKLEQQEMLNRIINERLTVRRTDEEISKFQNEKNKEMVGENNNMNQNFNNFNQGNNTTSFGMTPNNNQNVSPMNGIPSVPPMENQNNQFNPSMETNNVNQLIEQANNISPDFNIPTTPIQESTPVETPSQPEGFNGFNLMEDNNGIPNFNSVQPQLMPEENPKTVPSQNNFNEIGIPSFNNETSNSELRPVQFFNINDEGVSTNSNNQVNNDIFNFKPDPSQMVNQTPNLNETNNILPTQPQQEFVENLEDRAVNMDFGSQSVSPVNFDFNGSTGSINQPNEQINQFTQPEPAVANQQFFGNPVDPMNQSQVNIPNIPNINSNNNIPSFKPEEPQVVTPQMNIQTMNQGGIRQAIDELRNVTNKLEGMGFKIETEEFDLENAYQVIFRISKQ